VEPDDLESGTRVRDKRNKTNNNENNNLIDDYENYQDDVSLNKQNSIDFMSNNRKDSFDSNILGQKKLKISDPTFDLSKLNSYHSELEKNFESGGVSPKHIFG